MSCTNCGSAFHERWACPKPLKDLGAGKPAEVKRQPTRDHVSAHTKSTAARKDVPVFSPHRKSPSQGRVREPADKAGGQSVAPTEALQAGTQAPPVDSKRKGDRHRPGYYAEYMRKRRKAKREATIAAVLNAALPSVEAGNALLQRAKRRAAAKEGIGPSLTPKT